MKHKILISDTSPSYGDARNPDKPIGEIIIEDYGNADLTKNIYLKLCELYPSLNIRISMYKIQSQNYLIKER